MPFNIHERVVDDDLELVEILSLPLRNVMQEKKAAGGAGGSPEGRPRGAAPTGRMECRIQGEAAPRPYGRRKPMQRGLARPLQVVEERPGGDDLHRLHTTQIEQVRDRKSVV